VFRSLGGGGVDPKTSLVMSVCIHVHKGIWRIFGKYIKNLFSKDSLNDRADG
jgi:hypothetical protein